jgi:hypothetical protein
MISPFVKDSEYDLRVKNLASQMPNGEDIVFTDLTSKISFSVNDIAAGKHYLIKVPSGRSISDNFNFSAPRRISSVESSFLRSSSSTPSSGLSFLSSSSSSDSSSSSSSSSSPSSSSSSSSRPKSIADLPTAKLRSRSASAPNNLPPIMQHIDLLNPPPFYTIPVMKGGKARVENLDAADAALLRGWGPEFDILYNRMDAIEKNHFEERIKLIPHNLYTEYNLPPVNRKSQKDITGATLQKHVLDLGKEITACAQAIRIGTQNDALELLNMAGTTASILGSYGSLMRLEARQPYVARVLRWSNREQILTDEMKRDYDAVKENFKGASFTRRGNGFNNFRYSKFGYQSRN